MVLTCAASTVLTAAWSQGDPATTRRPSPAQRTGTAVAAGRGAPGPLDRVGSPPPVAPKVGTPARLLPAVPAPAATAYALTQTGPDGRPATYDPCRAVHYVLSRAHLPPDGAARVAAAFATVSAATGLAFVDDGRTDEVVGTHRVYGRRPGGDWNPVLVGWATAREYPPLAADVAGLGGSTADRHGRLVSGQVAVDVRGPAPGPVLLHELGHLVGLAHVADPQQLMAPVANGRTTYGAGDLAGLAAAGAGPCEPST